MRKKCIFCDCNLELKKELIKKTIDNYNISYDYEYLYCPRCKKEIYDKELFNVNISRANDELRKLSGLIRKSQIEEISNKYSIGNKSLSLVLGFGEIQIDRYLKNGNPSKEHSNIMLSVLNNPLVYETYLITNKDKISDNVYKKTLSKLKQIEMSDEHSKLYNVAKYVLNKSDDVTNMAIQKILYFINGFSKQFLNEKLFVDDCEAWTHGPVYRDLYFAFCTYFKNVIDKNELVDAYFINLTDREKKYIDDVLPYFNNYSGSALRNMSHLTDPWIEAREGLFDEDQSDRIIDQRDIDDYFNMVIKKYNITKIEDISKYSNDLFLKSI